MKDFPSFATLLNKGDKLVFNNGWNSDIKTFPLPIQRNLHVTATQAESNKS